MTWGEGGCRLKGWTKKGEGREIELEFLTGEGEEGEIAIVEVGEENDNARVSSDGRNSMDGVLFLECLREEERYEEVEKKLEVTMKRGRDEGGEVKLKGRGDGSEWGGKMSGEDKREEVG
jgi:hypothetical protein